MQQGRPRRGAPGSHRELCLEAQKAQQQVVPRRCWRHQKAEKGDGKHVHLLDTRMRPDIPVIHPSDTDTVAYEWVSMAYGLP